MFVNDSIYKYITCTPFCRSTSHTNGCISVISVTESLTPNHCMIAQN